MQESTSDLTDGLLETGWLLVAILVPLWVNLWASRPFELPKAALLRTLVWLMVGVWLAGSLLSQRSPWRDLRRNPLLWPAVALTAVQVAATALAADRGLSLWGSYERGQGLLTLLSYTALFLLVAGRMRTPAQAWRLVGAMMVTAVPMLLLGVGQALGWRPVGLVTNARSQVFATLGRSNFLGAYLAVLLPLTLAFSLTTPQRRLRLAGVALLAGEAVLLGLTLSRGALLAAGVSVGIFALLWFWPRLRPLWRRLATAGGAVTVLGGLAGFLWWGHGQGGSITARLTIWRATLDLISRRSVLGYGPDAFGLVFPRVYPPQLVYYQGRGLYVDRAHNLVLDWLVTTGALGLVAAGALFAGFFVVGWRGAHAARRAGDRQRWAGLVACLAAVLGNAAGNLVSFDVVATATATSLLMGVTVALARPAQAPERNEEIDDASEAALWRWVLAGVTLATAIIAVVLINGRLLLADADAKVAQDRAAVGDWPAAVAAGQRAIAHWPHEPQYHVLLGWAYAQMAQAGRQEPAPSLERAESEMLAARDLRAADYRVWTALGDVYSVWGNRFDPAKLPLAHDAYRQAVQLAPNHAVVYAAWGMVDLEGGRFAQAVERFRQAVDLDATDGYSFSHLGDAELALGHVEEALAAYEQAVHWGPDLSYAHLGLARCYWQVGRPDEAFSALERALQLEPDNPTAQVLQRQMELEFRQEGVRK